MSNYNRIKLEQAPTFDEKAAQDSCVACPLYDGEFPCIGEVEFGQCPYLYNFNFEGVERG